MHYFPILVAKLNEHAVCNRLRLEAIDYLYSYQKRLIEKIKEERRTSAEIGNLYTNLYTNIRAIEYIRRGVEHLGCEHKLPQTD